MTFRGLTWDHPRGRHALEAAADAANSDRTEPLIVWDVQPLEGFESAPIGDLAAAYDILVLDHPHIGEAVAEDCLSPLDAHFPAATLAAWDAQTVGPAFASYRWAGRHWALPLDVATQVMASGPDGPTDPPARWDDVEAIAARGGVALSLAGPHASLTLMSMVAGQGGDVGGARFLDPALGAEMLERMHRLFARRAAGSETLNPIALLEAMAHSGEITLVPLVFGYVNYARPSGDRRPIRFSDTIRSGGGRGGVLGGTGLALTARAAPDAELLAHISHLMDARTQIGFIPAHDGQPSARAAWRDAGVNAAWGDFYARTLATAETALLRPRFDGFVAFQTTAAQTIRDALERRDDPARTITELEESWTRCRETARGPVEDGKAEP